MLKRKMYRDIKNNLSQFITIFLMILIGVMAYSGINAYMDGMTRTADIFYKENNLQDLNLIGNDFNKNDLELIKKINNVKNAERKLSVTATTSNNKILLLNFIESNKISKFYIIKGEKFNANFSGIWLDNNYAEKNNIKVGDIIPVKYEKLTLKEKVLGLINVPDHVYDTKDESEIFPNKEEFGFAYLSINEIPKDYITSKIMNGNNINYKDYYIFNNIMVDVDDTNKINQVKNNIEDKVKNAHAIINIKDTPSYLMYQGEIDEGRAYVGVFSGLFLFIALLSIITTITRMVKKERKQIGTLKALGFSNIKILLHYMGYEFWISIIASILGLILGYLFIGKIFISLEMNFFEIPNGFPIITTKCYIVSILVVLAVLFITCINGLSILKENPAESLRSEMPDCKKSISKFTTKKIFKKINFATIWNIRDMLRNRMRTFMALVGVTGCCLLLVCALGMFDSLNNYVDLQYEKLYNFKYKINLSENISKDELSYIQNIYGKKSSKTYNIEIKKDNIRDANNIFVTDARDYIRFIDKEKKYLDIYNNNGVYITSKLAKMKNYKIGDIITWHIYGDSKYYNSKIIGFNRDPQNQNITMTRKYLENLNIKYKPDSIYTNKEINNKKILGIKNFQNRDSLKESVNNLLSMMKSMLYIIIFMAIVLGIIIIYNLGILSYTEKQYQFTTLKVLGFSDSRIKKVFVMQNNRIAIISIIIGLPSGFLLTDWIFKTAIEDHFDFWADINLSTYIISSLTTIIVSLLVSKILSKRIKEIDMVSSLKSDE